MSDGKCKSSFISPSVVLNATMEQYTDRGKAISKMGTSEFLSKINSNDFSSVFVPAKRARPRF